MVDEIRELLANGDLFVKKIDRLDKEVGSVSICWNPSVKWNLSEPIEDRDAFLLLFSRWIHIQKSNFSFIRPENKGKSTKTLLSELFGTQEFSNLEIEEIANQSIFQTLEHSLIDDHDNEKRRLKEIKSLKKAVGIMIKCKTGDVLYFGKTTFFYFLKSGEYLKQMTLPVHKEIYHLLFDDRIHKSARKRPGMYIGSLSKTGLYRLMFALIEDLLRDAAEKEISLTMRPQNVLEVVCESYSVQNNSSSYNHLSIANALSEYFEFQDERQIIRTEKSILTAFDHENNVKKGIKLIWKPDVSIFQNIDLDYYIVMNRMMELAALNRYRICLSDLENYNVIYIPSGVSSFLERNCCGYPSKKIITFDIIDAQLSGSIAVSFSAIRAETRKSYVNNQLSQEGGTDVEGVMRGVKKALERILSFYDYSLKPQDMIKHLNYVIHIQLDNPRWYGSMKGKLKNIEVKSIVQKQVEDQLYHSLKEDTQPLKSVYPGLF